MELSEKLKRLPLLLVIDKRSQVRSKILAAAEQNIPECILVSRIQKISGEVCQPSCCLGTIISCCPSSTTGRSRVIPSITTSYKRRTWPIEAITSRSLRDEHQSKLTNRVQCKVCNRCWIFICAKYASFLTNITRTPITLIGLKPSTFPSRPERLIVRTTKATPVAVYVTAHWFLHLTARHIFSLLQIWISIFF